MGTAQAQGIKEGSNAAAGPICWKKSIALHPHPRGQHCVVSIITFTMSLWPKCKHGFVLEEGVNFVFPAFC